MIDKKIIAGVLTAFGASLCCITPVLALLAGLTGVASSFSWLEPLRPYFIGLTVLVLGYAWWDKLKAKKNDIDCACDADEEGKVSFWHSKTFLMLITVFSIVMILFPYYGSKLVTQEAPKVVEVQASNVFKKMIEVEGMTCVGCEVTLEKSVKSLPGVISVKASSADKNAKVEFDKSQTNIDEIMEAIGKTGYKPTKAKDTK